MLTATLAPNTPLAYRSLDHIAANRKQWNQNHFWLVTECGTAACFAGWALHFAGIEISHVGKIFTDVFVDRLSPEVAEAVREHQMDRYLHVDERWPMTYVDTGEVAEVVLGLEEWQAHRLFDPDNSFGELELLVAEFFGPRPLTDDGALEMTPAEVAAEPAIDRLALPQPGMHELLAAEDIENTLSGGQK